jgi:hypothetical protein
MFWRWPLQHQATPEPEPTTTVQATDNVPATPRPGTNVASQDIPNQPPAVPSTVNPEPEVTDSPKLREVLKQFVDGKNVPVKFYGLVIDQDSNALSGVHIKVTVLQDTLPVPGSLEMIGTKNVPLERVTGTDGRFEISGLKGEAFDLESVQKDGYEVEPTRRGFGSTEGSYAEPVTFKMWSTNIHEELITGQKAFHIVPDGRPYFIDLTAGTIAESGSGDLKAWIKYAAPATRGQLSDWSCELDVINGGLLEQPLGSAMFSAPAEGYVPAFQSLQQIRGGQRGSSGEHQFYIRLKNGQEYGNITIGFYAPFNNQTPGLIRLSYAINPSGSRVLR